MSQRKVAKQIMWRPSREKLYLHPGLQAPLQRNLHISSQLTAPPQQAMRRMIIGKRRDANDGGGLRGCELIAAARSEVSRKIKRMQQARMLQWTDQMMAAVVEVATE
jgi:hypothetical protein